MSLTAKQVENALPKDKNYKLYDRDGLYLLITPAGGKYWRYDYRYAGKRKTLALGVARKVSLLEARNNIIEAQKLLDQGIDPSQKKKLDKLQRTHQSCNSFKSVALSWHSNQQDSWSESHAGRVKRQLEQRAFPFLGSIPITDLTARDILAILRKMESEGLGEATYKLKQRIGSVFTYAIAEGLVDMNPTFGLEKALKRKPKQKNNPHLNEYQMQDFLQQLENYEGTKLTQLAVKMIIHTLVRSTELRLAKWDEFDFRKNEWRIPAERMKMGEMHIVPLSNQVSAILDEIKEVSPNGEHLFSSRQSWRRPFSANTMINALYRMGYKDQTTVHGFRGTASTILIEQGFNSDVIEKQLSHGDRDKIRAAYNHASYMEERRTMMQWYSDKIDLMQAGKIIALRRA